MDNETIYWICSKCTGPARITTQREKLLQQTNGHNHAVDETDFHVEQVRSNLRKRAREEVVNILLSFLSFLFIYVCTYITHLKITLIITF